jgi:glycosyltransferase involved in cell wall biosynthesis
MLVKPIDISVVVPVYNEYESLPELEQWIDRVMTANKFSYQLILIDDGSSDESWEVIEQLIEKNDSVLGLRFRRNYGKSAALYCGFDEAQGEVVITMDADLQDSPDEIPALYKMIVQSDFSKVIHVTLFKRVTSCLNSIFVRKRIIKQFTTLTRYVIRAGSYHKIIISSKKRI